MLLRLTRRSRIRAGMALLALYALCVIGSPLSMAFAGAKGALPCFTDEHPTIAAVDTDLTSRHAHHSASHHHQQANLHDVMDHSAPPAHGDHGDHKRIGACCAVLCFAAVTNELAVPFGEPPHSSLVGEVLQAGLSGRTPERLDRPPSIPFMTS